MELGANEFSDGRLGKLQQSYLGLGRSAENVQDGKVRTDVSLYLEATAHITHNHGVFYSCDTSGRRSPILWKETRETHDSLLKCADLLLIAL